MNPKPEYSIVIPVYGTNQSLSELADRIKKVFSERIEGDYELIFVDDFSPNLGTIILDLNQLFGKFLIVFSWK